MSGIFDNGDQGGGQPPRRTVRPLPADRPPSRSRALLITAGVLVIGFLMLTAVASFWTERLWFKSIGYGDVFTRLLWTRVGLFFTFGVVMALVVGLNIYLAWRVRPIFRPASPEQTSLDRYRDAVTPIGRWLVIGVAGLMGIFAGTSGASQWRSFMLWRHGVPFGKTDPYFDKDIGFYVFDLAWWHYLVDFVMAAVVLALIASAVVHYLFGGIRLQGTHDRLSGAAAAQLSTLLGVFVLAKAGDYWLDRYDLLDGSGKLITGMGYTDDHAVLPAKNILLGIAVICALLFFLNVWRRTWLLPSVGLGLYVLSAILLGLIWPGVVQQFQVSPTEADKEAKYITSNIEATREAYGLQGIEETPYSGTSTATKDDLPELEAATASVPLVDPKIVAATFEQTQQIRGYYAVEDVLDVDRYDIDGTDRALVVGAREIAQSGLADTSKNWSNLHTVYTHGYGMIAAYGNQRPASNASVASENAQWAENSLPPAGKLSDANGGYEGRIYFGETSPDYSIVGKGDGGTDVEFDLPNGGSEEASGVVTTYDGEDGVAIGGLWHQLLYAVKFGDPNIVLSQRVNDNSKIIYDREPAARVEKVAPWLTIDGDPYPSVVDGKIVWILDGYTTTDRYPQSEKASFEDMTTDSLDDGSQFRTVPTDEINYMRNAVKATVDAYDGTVTLYAWDDTDPILKAWTAAFPGVVQPKSAISPDLMKHLRYPEDLFKVQRYQFARYHVTDAGDWYESNDRWQVPEDPNAVGRLQPPYRLFTEMPGTTGSTFSLTSAFVPNKRANLVSFLAANSDATSPDYGELRVLRVGNENTLGPGQVANKFTTNEKVSEALFPFKSQGSTPVYGNLLTFPVAGGLMYVEPLYALRTGEASYPVLKFVLVYFEGRVGIADTLEHAIADVLGAPVTEPSGPTTTPGTGKLSAQVRAKLAEAEAQFRLADRLQRQGDTVGWATALAKAESLVKEALDLVPEPTKQPTEPSSSPSTEPSTEPSTGSG